MVHWRMVNRELLIRNQTDQIVHDFFDDIQSAKKPAHTRVGFLICWVEWVDPLLAHAYPGSSQGTANKAINMPSSEP
jgi:hypothetical protein